MSSQPFNAQNQPLTFAARAAITAKFGIPVMPLESRNKKAFLDEWQNLATTDAAQIARWDKQNPAFNCAAVGRKGGFWILDVDAPTLFARIEKETNHSLDELDTLVVKSSGEKRHYYFKHDSRSEAMGNFSDDDKDGEVFSVRAHNAYVVSAGSIHPKTGQPYEVITEPSWGEIPTAPDWLMNWLSAYSKTSAAKTKRMPETIPLHARNKTLTSLAGAMRRKGANETEILAALRATNQRCEVLLCDAELMTIAGSISKYPPASTETHANPFTSSGTSPTSAQEETADTTEDTITPAYPMDTIDGDLIGELTRALTDGTFIPPQFMRENIKVALGSIVDGLVGFPNHEDLHTREYLHNVSMYPQSGKGESYKRTSQPSTGFLSALLTKLGVCIVDGGLFGSGEFMVKILKDAPTHRALARFDEMSEVWTKNRAIGCTLEKKLLTLFESTSAAQGSFKNGTNTANDFHLSLVGDFTKESFDASFTGSGSRGSGYLSRCVFQFADRQPCEGDWLSTDTEKVRRVLSDIEARLAEILNGESRYVPAETAEAKSLRLEFYAWLDTQDARVTPRLKDHLKRDALLRAVLAGETITTEMMRRSIEWCKNQLDNRLALFPEDAGSPTEIMERSIIRTLKAKGEASVGALKHACHVSRPGSGGHEVFNRAVRSLRFSHEIKEAGTTRSGTPCYALFGAI